MAKHICDFCGVYFIGYRPKGEKKYCSRRCYGLSFRLTEEEKKERVKEYYIKTEDRRKEYQREYHIKNKKKYKPKRKYVSFNKDDLLVSNGHKPRNGNIKQCPTCKIYFYESPSGNGIYCSKKCKDFEKVEKEILVCGYCGKEYAIYKSYLTKRKSVYCSKKCRAAWQEENLSGENSATWEGGKSKESKRIRASANWKRWRISVFERDNYTCQDCGQTGGYLEPHHIKPFAYFIEERFDIENGITLCKKCHNKTKIGKNAMDELYGELQCQ